MNKKNAAVDAGTSVGGERKNTSEGIFSVTILRQPGQAVNRFSCGFIRTVYELTAQPIRMIDLCRLTNSDRNRVRLALHDLTAAGVGFEVIH